LVAVLDALDDKIELNRRMNETLEAMARAIFKDWFVDFGPTRAKMEGRAPYLAPDIWALFPNGLDGEGKPEGWGQKRVEDILELAYGKALKASERTAGPIPVYGSGGVTGYHNEALVEGPSIIVGRKGTVGVLYWEDRPFFPIDTVFYVKPRAPLTFCYYHLQTLGLESMNTDAAVPGLNRSNVYRLSVPWGEDELRKQFDRLVAPLRQRMRSNSEENETLAATRDLLLPKLMSGEVRLRDGEKAVEAST
jgi:type I restriction enzyme S subunit